MARPFLTNPITDDSALGGAVIERSLKFNPSDNANLTRTSSSASTTFTYSVWIKRCTFTGYQYIFSMGNRGFAFHTTNNTFYLYDTSGLNESTARFRDPSAWYHIVVQINSGVATSYVNNVLVHNAINGGFTLTTGSNETRIGVYNSNDYDFNGYMAEINLVDGSVVAPSSFGYTESQTGLWRPKRYTGSYGTNGFYLNFSDNSGTTATTLGKDSSGNGNNFTPNNFSVSAGTGNDSLEDTPTNTFATLSPLLTDTRSSASFSEGNLKVTTGSGAGNIGCSMGVKTGKWYAEFKCTAKSSVHFMIGVATIKGFDGERQTNESQNGGYGLAYLGGDSSPTGNKMEDGGGSSAYGAAYNTGDIIGVALDMDNNTVNFAKNNSYQGSLSISTTKGDVFTFCMGGGQSGATQTFEANFGANAFNYTPPSGFKALCSNNLLPNVPSVIKPQRHFDCILYTGNGASVREVTGLEFQPDMVWVKSRSQNYTNHGLTDSVKTDPSYPSNHTMLYPNLTNAETGGGNYFTLTTSSGRDPFLKDGFILNNNSSGNNNGSTYVAWCWKAGGGTSSSNPFMIDGKPYATAAAAGLNGGTANPTGASVNTKAGFSIVTYTATNNQNVSYSHGLNQAPEMIIIKDRDNTRNWGVYYTINGTNTNWMILNSDAVQGNNDSGVTPTGGSNNTYMYLHQDYFAPSYNSFANGGNDGSSKMVAYMWHSVSGYSKFGTYKGNSNANGTFVHVGFRPAWLMIKRTTGADAWVIYDNKRDSDNVMRNRLAPNTNANDAADDAIDFLSNGFKWRINSGLRNDSSHTYIFMAFAEQPGITPYDTQTNAR